MEEGKVEARVEEEGGGAAKGHMPTTPGAVTTRPQGGEGEQGGLCPMENTEDEEGRVTYTNTYKHTSSHTCIQTYTHTNIQHARPSALALLPSPHTNVSMPHASSNSDITSSTLAKHHPLFPLFHRKSY